jgi:hypothetical protein
MRRSVVLLFVLGTLLYPADKKRNPKLPEVEIVEAKGRRVEGRLLVDGTVRNSGTKQIQKLILLFAILDSDDQMISTNKTTVDEEILAPKAESDYHAEMVDLPRGIKFRITAEDGRGKELSLSKPGPYVFE